MTITTLPSIKDDRLIVGDKVVLTAVPANVGVSPVTHRSAFIGATSSTSSSRHLFSVGVLERHEFLCLYRFKMWWMIPRLGKSGSEVPVETQMLLLKVAEESALTDESSTDSENERSLYVLILPVLDGVFRATLQGTSENELQLCVESGDANVKTSEAMEAVFINSGDNPFEVITDSMKVLEKVKGTFSRIDNKKTPSHLDLFGWCTWDAFYTDVNPQGIKEGLQSFSAGGVSPKFLIIDDGWQETINEYRKEGEPDIEGIQFATRLADIKENKKFRGSGSDDSLQELVHSIKERYGLKYVYVWHALAGYWGGVLPSSESMKKYNPKIEYPIQSPGNVSNLRDIVVDVLEKYGLGVIHPEKIYEFYNDLHGYLASIGVDGVKVDVQNIMETLGTGYGGRVTITRQYEEALEQSVVRNFKETNLICCMSHNTDSIYSSKKSAVARVSEDFMPREPTFQTLHVAAVSFNSLLLGEIVVPDWDMFQSKHETAEFHGAARALGGCAVYVSDKPGNHDFKILRKLVLPDGSVLRARHAGRPTRDCLFRDTVMDGKSVLKIWNLNKLTGVIGVFNCQGAGHWPLMEVAKNEETSTCTKLTLTGSFCPNDVEFLEDVAGENWDGDCAVYAFNSGLTFSSLESFFPPHFYLINRQLKLKKLQLMFVGSLCKLKRKESLQVGLRTLECEIYTISPIRVFSNDVHFTPIGSLDMYNSGGAIETLSHSMEDLSQCTIKMTGRFCGRFGAYSSTKPRRCVVDMKEVEFTYESGSGLLTVKLEDGSISREIDLVYRYERR
ncbi:putative galactinol--sucrose galactosyltransferase 2 isoform X1 [Cucumis melo var. makuwa]|uniref:galactinol--sucrose galactosyltransferase n=1 Tax=Cucumis melo var. makuwa TaxID=1194695 RepID=A0A5A7URM2_CUCMM|nr:putative galactinol--sucrose galactosyltransferase 2 isoform X1 [Cucumis melo var. makuwa]